MSKNKDIRLIWHGHSCFTMICDDYRIVLDPFKDDTVPGYSRVRETADLVLCSHEHGDHNFREAVELTRRVKANPFTVTEIEIPHDEAGGSKRGKNLIRVFDNGALRVAHFGDIGCPLSGEQRAKLGELDAVMVPVGGFYTMEPQGIADMLAELSPRVIVPMHYRSDSFGYDVIGTLEDFLKLTDQPVTRLEDNVVEIREGMQGGILVPAYRG